MYVAPPMRMGAWSMACVLWWRIECYLYTTLTSLGYGPCFFYDTNKKDYAHDDNNTASFISLLANITVFLHHRGDTGVKNLATLKGVRS